MQYSWYAFRLIYYINDQEGIFEPTYRYVCQSSTANVLNAKIQKVTYI